MNEERLDRLAKEENEEARTEKERLSQEAKDEEGRLDRLRAEEKEEARIEKERLAQEAKDEKERLDRPRAEERQVARASQERAEAFAFKRDQSELEERKGMSLESL